MNVARSVSDGRRQLDAHPSLTLRATCHCGFAALYLARLAIS